MYNNENDNQGELEEDNSSDSQNNQSKEGFSFQFKRNVQHHSHQFNNTTSNTTSNVDNNKDYDKDQKYLSDISSEEMDTRNLIFKNSQPFSFEKIINENNQPVYKKIEHDAQRNYKNYDILDVVEDLVQNDYSHLKNLHKGIKNIEDTKKEREEEETLHYNDVISGDNEIQFANNEYEKEELNEFEEDVEQNDTYNNINDHINTKELSSNKKFISKNSLNNSHLEEQPILSSLEIHAVSPAIEVTQQSSYLKKSYRHLKDVAIGTTILSLSTFACAFLFGLFSFSSSSHYQADPNFEPIIQTQPPIIQNENNNLNNGIVINGAAKNNIGNLGISPFNNLAYTISQVPHFDSLSSDNQVNLLSSLINFKQYQSFNQLLDKQKVSTAVLSELLSSYSSVFASEPEYFNSFKKILGAGADWKQDQYLFLKQTSSSKDWRHYWIDYFSQKQPDMLPVYAYIIKESIGPEAEPVLNSLN